MAPRKKVNKKIGNVNEDRPSKEGPTTATKIKIKKRKLVELEGPQWTEEELKTFYDSYCKYGEDWKKVSSTVGSRTPHLVEALYNMNRTYLSLPDGAASATGLIAKMTDHYNNVERNNNENESHESPTKTPRKSPPKHGTLEQKIKSKDSEARILDICPYKPTSSNIAALSDIKIKRYGVGIDLFSDIKTRAVRKRTSRWRIHKKDNRNLGFPSSTESQNKDERFCTEATVLVDFQNDNSQQVPHMQSSNAAINSKLERNKSKEVRFHNKGEGTLRSNNSPNRPSFTQKKNMATIDGKTGSKSKKFNKKNLMCMTVNKSNDAQDDCNNMEEHNNSNGEELKNNGNAKSPWASTLSKKIYYDGEGIEKFTALCTLADAVVLQSNIDESEALHQIKDDNKKIGSNKKQSKPKASGKNNKRKVNRGDTDGGTCKKTKTAKEDAILEISHPEPQKGKKHNSTLPEITEDETNSDLARLEIRKDEVQAANQASKSVEFSPSMICPTGVFVDGSKTLATDNLTHSSFELKTMNRSRRKSGMVNAFSKRENTCSERPSSHPYNYPLHLKEKLPHALSNSLFRRWCRFERFHSAIDYPWFVQNEFEECLNKFEEHLNNLELGYLGSLTRDWVLIRRCIGKPRRFSAKFLNEQRVHLTKYRQVSREQCKSLLIGQRVIACYPKSRELHGGCILTVDGDHYRVQFDDHDLGVESVPDIDCMLLNSLEYTSEALRRQNVYACRPGVRKLNRNLRAGAPRFSSNQSVAYVSRHFHAATHPKSCVLKQTEQNNICSVSQARATLNEAASVSRQVLHKQPCALLEIQEREAGIRALTELSCALNKKEALVMELRNLHEDYIRMQAKPDTSHDLKLFRNQYAAVHSGLQEAHDQVECALGTLRQYNTYNRDAPNLLSRSAAIYGEPTELLNSSELTENSRQKAKMMIDAAFQVICTTNEGEDPSVRIGEVLDRLNNCNSGSVSNAAVTRYIASDSGRPSSTCQQDNFSSPIFDPSAMSAESSKNLLYQFITSCLSAHIMIKDCIEKQHPPEYMAKMLDSSLLSVKPHCPENMDVYWDIKDCINNIKSMMLARIPTPNTITQTPAIHPSTPLLHPN